MGLNLGREKYISNRRRGRLSISTLELRNKESLTSFLNWCYQYICPPPLKCTSQHQGGCSSVKLTECCLQQRWGGEVIGIFHLQIIRRRIIAFLIKILFKMLLLNTFTQNESLGGKGSIILSFYISFKRSFKKKHLPSSSWKKDYQSLIIRMF